MTKQTENNHKETERKKLMLKIDNVQRNNCPTVSSPKAILSPRVYHHAYEWRKKLSQFPTQFPSKSWEISHPKEIKATEISDSPACVQLLLYRAWEGFFGKFSREKYNKRNCMDPSSIYLISSIFSLKFNLISNP